MIIMLMLMRTMMPMHAHDEKSAAAEHSARPDNDEVKDGGDNAGDHNDDAGDDNDDNGVHADEDSDADACS